MHFASQTSARRGKCDASPPWTPPPHPNHCLQGKGGCPDWGFASTCFIFPALLRKLSRDRRRQGFKSVGFCPAGTFNQQTFRFSPIPSSRLTGSKQIFAAACGLWLCLVLITELCWLTNTFILDPKMLMAQMSLRRLRATQHSAMLKQLRRNGGGCQLHRLG